MKAENKLISLKFFTGDRENLEAAIGCFIQALNKYPESSPIRTSILMELANDLTGLNHKNEAASYYEQALQTVTESTMKVMCMRHLMNLKIDCEKYDEALEIANNIIDTNQNLIEDVLAEVQVSRILLALLIRPSEQSKPVSLKQLFIDIMNDNESEAIPLNTDFRLKLQSIVLCRTMGDVPSLIRVVADAKRFLTLQQIDLAHRLVSDDSLEL